MPSRQPHESSITPEGVSTFEHVVRRLHLSPEEYATSAALKAWARKNKDQKYVPSHLLVAWHFDVNVQLFSHSKKPPKRAA
jgi:hypothetical protein